MLESNLFSNLPEHLREIEGGRLRKAVELAVQGGNKTLEFFQSSDFHVEKKSDRSPVTIADRQAELLIREALQSTYPDDHFLGEEFGESNGETISGYRWIIDPIDGTKSFISGVPLYSTLVGVTKEGMPTIGVIYIPAMKEIIVAASGCGAWYSNASSSWVRSRVSKQSNLGEGLFLVSQVDNFDARNARVAFDRISEEAYITRTWGDGYGYLLVATGRAEVMVDPIVNPWDVAAVLPVIVEAGGRFTDWKGELSIETGDAVGSNGLVHDRILSHLNQT